jgi:hypothetical protein
MHCSCDGDRVVSALTNSSPRGTCRLDSDPQRHCGGRSIGWSAPFWQGRLGDLAHASPMAAAYDRHIDSSMREQRCAHNREDNGLWNRDAATRLNKEEGLPADPTTRRRRSRAARQWGTGMNNTR